MSIEKTAHSKIDFSEMHAAPARIPIWYWNRHVLLRLREAAARQLDRCGVSASSRVLELGCGNRPYQGIVEQRGAKYEGADLAGNRHADWLIDEASGRVATDAAQFDVVLSIQVLEHVPDPPAYLAEARRLLRPGGRLILSTHGFWVYHPSPGDYWRWTGAGLQKLLQDQGLRIIHFEGIVGLVPGALQLLQDYLRNWLPRLLQKPFTTLMQALISLTDRIHGDAARAQNAMIYMALVEPVGPQSMK